MFSGFSSKLGVGLDNEDTFFFKENFLGRGKERSEVQATGYGIEGT